MGILIPGVLTFLALAVGGLGVRFASRTPRPRLFKWGAIIAATGFMLLWLLPWWAISQQAGIWAMPLFVAALFISISVLGAGMTAMARATTGHEDTPFDRILQDSAFLSDRP